MLPERGWPRSGIKEAPVGLCVMPSGVTLNWSRLTRMLATITATSCGDPYDLKGRDVLPNVFRIATFPSDFPTFPRHQVAARGHNALSGGSTVRSTLLSAPQLDRYLTRGDYHGKYRHPEADHQEGCVAVSPDVSSGNHSNTTPTSAAYRHDRQEAKRCAKVKKREQLELVRPFSGQIGRRLLPRHASAVTSDEITSGQPAPYGLEGRRDRRSGWRCACSRGCSAGYSWRSSWRRTPPAASTSSALLRRSCPACRHAGLRDPSGAAAQKRMGGL